MKIGILQTGHSPDEMRPDIGDYSDLFEKFLQGNGFTFAVYNVVDMMFPGSVHDCEGWLITGSKHGAYEEHAFIPPLEKLIRDIYAADVPLVGVCFGHQIIAQALGGKVKKFKDGWAVGYQTYDWQGETVALNAWHQDQVVEKPTTATRIGSTDFCENAALLYDDVMWTIQPHPEYGADFIDGLITYRGKGLVPAPLLQDARERLDAPLDSASIAQQMTDFFKKARA